LPEEIEKLPTLAALKHDLSSGTRAAFVRRATICSRNSSGRTHVEPTLPVLFPASTPLPEVDQVPGVKLQSAADERWPTLTGSSRSPCCPMCWPRTPPSLPRADEAVYIDNGIVTECSASNSSLVWTAHWSASGRQKSPARRDAREVMLELARKPGHRRAGTPPDRARGSCSGRAAHRQHDPRDQLGLALERPACPPRQFRPRRPRLLESAQAPRRRSTHKPKTLISGIRLKIRKS